MSPTIGNYKKNGLKTLKWTISMPNSCHLPPINPTKKSMFC